MANFKWRIPLISSTFAYGSIMSGSSALLAILGIAQAAFLVKALGVEKFGLYVSILTYVGFLYQLASFKLVENFLFYIKAKLESAQAVKQIILLTFLFSIIPKIIALTLFVLFITIIDSDHTAVNQHIIL